MKNKILEIKNLKVGIKNKEIINKLNLQIEKGKVYAVMGPNGSGKSTFANAIMGSPIYEVSNGEIIFDGENINKMKVDERAKNGIFMSFQYPQAIEGVSVFNLLKQSLEEIKGKRIELDKFKKELEKKADKLGIKKEFLSRSVNLGFSGGEKKRMEILQMLIIEPEIAILDETDSGLDIDALKIVATGINELVKKGKTILLITHYQRILNHVVPDKVIIMLDGKIAASGEKELIAKIEKKGYGWLKKVKNV